MYNWTALHLAASYNDDPAIITALLDAGADATARDLRGNTPWDYASDREELQDSDVYQRLSEAQALAADLESLSPCAEWTAREFFESATLAEVRGCLTAGADLGARDKSGATPLHLAAWYSDDPAVVTTLVDAGADVRARDDDGDTPLHLAAWYNANSAVVTTLVEAGADLDAQEDAYNWTPLHAAALANANPAIITALVDAGADVRARDDDGDTPLHLAASYNDDPAVITALIDAGADLDARDDLLGWTPLHTAVRVNANPPSSRP